MPTKPLDRLMFAQGGICFFCKKPLPKSEASVEHLVASANGGSNSDENCVACCKAVNALLGSMSLKEKIQVVLNQKGQFKCPNGTGSAKAVTQTLARTDRWCYIQDHTWRYSRWTGNLTSLPIPRSCTVLCVSGEHEFRYLLFSIILPLAKRRSAFSINIHR